MTIDYSTLQAIPQREEPYHIVVTAAHHDDIEFGVAGSVARWIREEGATVTYVIITDGGAGSNDPDISREQLVELRYAEQMAAAARVGVRDVRFLGYPDGHLGGDACCSARYHARHPRDQALSRRLPGPNLDIRASRLHQSSRSPRGRRSIDLRRLPQRRDAADLPRTAGRRLRAAQGWRALLESDGNAPTHYHDISSTIDLKMAALSAHVSQIGAGDDFENGAKKWLMQGNRDGGAMVGVEYAEYFRVLKFDEERESWYKEEMERREREAATVK